MLILQMHTLARLLEVYMKEFDTAAGVYQPTSIFHVDLTDSRYLMHVMLPEVDLRAINKSC